MTQHFAAKSAKFQNNGKNGPSEILILISSISYLSMIKKAKWFFNEKKLHFSK